MFEIRHCCLSFHLRRSIWNDRKQLTSVMFGWKYKVMQENCRFDDTSPFSFLRLQPTLILKDLTVVSGQSACRSSQISVILLRIKMASGDELPSHLTVDTSNVQILNSETSKRLVENFVIALMNKERFYIRTFFSTYKAYTTAESVLYILLDNSGNNANIPSCEELENPIPPETVAEIRK
ncbi:ral guanine nucleotide dissociation stimulator-like 1 [Stegostoma tigrinum]|uniref:ral guanine nucleotide dissociation stimulator-like 1 n=1 Tax=Stegostoma tigrinum TaxID=3053191 RepID=UPI00287033BF|nr:ral guanine nucleotide dissociation stimulator-like 1 [Stegostoma tigrinum]